MATMEVITSPSNNVQQLFNNLKSHKSLLTKSTDLYKTLTSHFISLQNSINSKTLTLDSNFISIDSNYQKSLSNLNSRETSIPSRFETLSSEIETKKNAAIDAYQHRIDKSAPLKEVLMTLCRRMDHLGLMKYVIEKKREIAVLKNEIGVALKECVDPMKLVLETVKKYLKSKAKWDRVVDFRWACGVIVTGLFPPEELMKKTMNGGVGFSRKMAVEAENVVRDWKERSEKSGDRMGSAECAMFLQVVIGFGLTSILDKEFCENVAMEFCARRDMAMLAIPIFGDNLPDFIDQLIKNGKEVEAVYFATEAGLTERFQPISLLMSFLQKSKMKCAEILKKGNDDEEAIAFELSYIRPIITCVEDHKLQSQFPIGNLKRRISSLLKAKLEKKTGSKSTSRPSSKRTRGSGAPSRDRGGPPPRSEKRPKYPSRGKREKRSPNINPVSRYVGPYNSAGPTIYDTGLTATTYGQRFGAPVVSSADQVTQQYYGVPGGSAPSPSPSGGPQLTSYGVPAGSVPNYYGLQTAYGYGATTTTSTYQPPPYAP